MRRFYGVCSICATALPNAKTRLPRAASSFITPASDAAHLLGSYRRCHRHLSLLFAFGYYPNIGSPEPPLPMAVLYSALLRRVSVLCSAILSSSPSSFSVCYPGILCRSSSFLYCIIRHICYFIHFSAYLVQKPLQNLQMSKKSRTFASQLQNDLAERHNDQHPSDHINLE